ncbi:hypothetical protein ACQKPE_01620 [Pseudomonas sp. NPDC089554]|uniref:hypothetical protein n=1 Tax=Pseudomonas sp. NPDC089554 TaxID=3390653 RepID=UPI003D0765F6
MEQVGFSRMHIKTISGLLLASALAGCGGIASIPYVEPALSPETARVRVITNSDVFGDSLTTNCIPKTRHLMARAGRQFDNGQPHESYPQFPLQPHKIVGMPDRSAPGMIKLQPGIRMAEGMYAEVETEYLVPTNAPFMVSTLGAVMGSYGSTDSVCPMDAKVFELKAGKDYEVFVGMHPVQTPAGPRLSCALSIRRLAVIGKVTVPIPVDARPAPKDGCKN